jgi:hypothetical protein
MVKAGQKKSKYGFNIWVLTRNGKPITLGKLEELEKRNWKLDEMEPGSFLCGPSQGWVISAYLHYVGFTWAERPKGIEATRL